MTITIKVKSAYLDDEFFVAQLLRAVANEFEQQYEGRNRRIKFEEWNTDLIVDDFQGGWKVNVNIGREVEHNERREFEGS